MGVSGAKAEAFNGRYTRRDTNNPDLTRRLRNSENDHPLYRELDRRLGKARELQILKAYPWYEKDDGSGHYIHYAWNACWYIQTPGKDLFQYCGGGVLRRRGAFLTFILALPDPGSDGIPAFAPGTLRSASDTLSLKHC